jgi:hypothetical protein
LKFDPHRPTHPGGRPLRPRALPFWEASDVPVAAHVEAHAAALLAELPNILQPDGQFKRVHDQSEYFKGRALGGASGENGFMKVSTNWSRWLQRIFSGSVADLCNGSLKALKRLLNGS